MKTFALCLLFTCLLSTAGMTQTNDFFDDAETLELGLPVIEIAGEVGNPGPVDFSKLPKHSVIVKEARFNEGNTQFVGAYRYDGYSLYDILNAIVLKKKSDSIFPPPVDLYVIVENNIGERTVFSWGELYYPVHRHEVIIASQVARIVPVKTKNQWPLPIGSRLVVGADFFNERYLANPRKITVKSYARPFEIKKGMRPMFAPLLSLYSGDQKLTELKSLPKALAMREYPSIFYGRGVGIHATSPIKGFVLKEVLTPYFKINAENLRTGYLVISGKDGYHAVFSVSEVFNRNDQAEFMIYTLDKDEDGGRFKIFCPADFLSDRAIKSAEALYFETIIGK